MDTRSFSRQASAPRREYSSRDTGSACVPPPESSQEWSTELVYNTYHHHIRSLALSLVGNDPDAEDVVQEVLLQVVLKLHTFRGEAALSTWLHRVIVNAALLQQRRQKLCREQHLGPLSGGSEVEDDTFACDPAAAPEHVALRNELRQSIEQAIAQLPPDYRAVYVAAEIEGLPNAEVSDRLGLTLPAVKSRLLRCRMMLRALLTSYVHGPLD